MGNKLYKYFLASSANFFICSLLLTNMSISSLPGMLTSTHSYPVSFNNYLTEFGLKKFYKIT